MREILGHPIKQVKILVLRLVCHFARKHAKVDGMKKPIGRPVGSGTPPETIAEAKRMLRLGIPPSQVSSELGVSLTKVYEWRRAIEEEEGR